MFQENTRVSQEITASVSNVYNTTAQDITGEHNFQEITLEGVFDEIWAQSSSLPSEGDEITGKLQSAPLNINGKTENKPVFVVTNTTQNNNGVLPQIHDI